ncbi:MAG: DNA internalization-related competence protein ComEC/Rec2, partial [bacterium]
NNITKKGKILLNIYAPDTSIHYGDVIFFTGKLKRPRGFRNPGLFNYEFYLQRQGIYATCNLQDSSAIKYLDQKGNQLLSIPFRLREYLANKISVSYPPEVVSLLNGLVLGLKGGINKSTEESFQKAGLMHLLAISGFHLGIIAVSFFLFIKIIFLILPHNILIVITDFINIKKLSSLFIIFIVIFYTLLTGYRYSSIKAAILIITYLIATILEFQEDIYNILVLAAFIILLWKPASLFDVDVQLSFMATFLVIYVCKLLKKKNRREHNLDHAVNKGYSLKSIGTKLYYLFIISSFLILGMAPLVSFYFYYLSIAGFISNLIAIPLTYIIINLTLVSSSLSIISKNIALPFLYLNRIFSKTLLFLVNFFAKLPYSSFYTFKPSFFELVLIYLFLFFLFTNYLSKRKKISILLATISIFLIDLYITTAKSPYLKANFLDVGQGDASLIELPNRSNLLIDGGGIYKDSFDMAENIIIPYLCSKKMLRVDNLILSHPESDHIYGLLSLVKKFKVKRVIDIQRPFSPPLYEKFLRVIKEKKIEHYLIKAGDELFLDKDVTIKLIYPQQELNILDKSNKWFNKVNNQSLVLKLTYNDVSFLYPGDIEAKAERFIVEANPFHLLDSTILKVPHHGSKTSSSIEFIEAVQPRLAIVSAGYNNQFNLPNKEVLKRYQKKEVQIYQTNDDGAIIIETNGRDYWGETWSGR